MKKSHFLGSGREPMKFFAKPSGPKTQPDWTLQFVTGWEGSIVFTWGPFEVALGARPITILYPGFAMGKVKKSFKWVNWPIWE